MSEPILSALESGLNPKVAQKVYRAVLDALANPGTVRRLPETDYPAALLPVLSLADLETSVAVIEDVAEDLGYWADITAVATGAPSAHPAAAKYIASLAPLTPEIVLAANRGTALAPEAGATIIAHVDSLAGGADMEFSGPGVDGEITVAPAIPTELWTARATAVEAFPAGIELLLVDGDGAMMGVSRTTVVASAQPSTTPKEK